MHHKRVLNEKKALNEDINKLKNLHTIYEQKYQELQTKYEAAMKEKMLVKMDRDRLLTKSEVLNQTIKSLQNKFNKEGGLNLENLEENNKKKSKKNNKNTKLNKNTKQAKTNK